ncbi:MAG: SpoIID/LytB domain-containing protein [Clostridia bacterium]
MYKKRYFIGFFIMLYILMNIIPWGVNFFWRIRTTNLQNENKNIINESASNVSISEKVELEKIKNDGYFTLYDQGIVSTKEEDKLIKVKYLDYLILATACEVYPDYNKEAIKAQAICCFTYALNLRLNNENDDKPILTVDSSKFLGFATTEQFKQRWGENFDLYYKKFEQCAKDVLGNCIVYEDKPIIAAYHAISTGKTEDSGVVWQKSLDYLKPIDSEGDKLAKDFERKTEILTSDIKSIFEKSDLTKDLVIPEDFNNLITDVVKNDSQTVVSAKLATVTFSGQEIRKIFNLPSASFDYSYDNATQKIIFKNIGYGHCVGLSQNGADFMARQGKNYEEILKHYFTGVQLKKVF